ncbi:hypothetical protein OROMI_021102 [Orobanche minor]
MGFWGMEVETGKLANVQVGAGNLLRLTQVCLGDSKKKTKEKFVNLKVTVETNELFLATLHYESLPQQLFSLVFDKDFQISHTWENGSVEEETPVPVANEKPEAKKEEKAVIGGKIDPGKQDADDSDL